MNEHAISVLDAGWLCCTISSTPKLLYKSRLDWCHKKPQYPKCKSILCQDHCNCQKCGMKKKNTFPVASNSLPFLLPHRHFWLFGVQTFLYEIKKCPNFHVCVLAFTTWPCTASASTCLYMLSLPCYIASVVFSLTMEPIGHLETIFQRLIVSDGHGLKKKEREPLQKKGAQTSAELSWSIRQ